MNHIFRTGFSFGLTSGVITTLGLIIGLFYGTKSELAVIGGILTIAVADAFSDALGMHISTEARTKKKREIWGSTFATFISKLLFALSFLAPILIFDFGQTAIYASVVWGLLLIGLLSFKVAKDQKKDPAHVVTEHVLIATIVIITTYYIGRLIASIF